MRTTIENLGLSRTKLIIKVPYEEFKSSLGAAYKEVDSQIQIPNFRHDHVPNRIIDQRIGRRTVIQKVVSSKLSDFYWDAVTEAEWVPML